MKNYILLTLQNRFIRCGRNVFQEVPSSAPSQAGKVKPGNMGDLIKEASDRVNRISFDLKARAALEAKIKGIKASKEGGREEAANIVLAQIDFILEQQEETNNNERVFDVNFEDEDALKESLGKGFKFLQTIQERFPKYQNPSIVLRGKYKGLPLQMIFVYNPEENEVTYKIQLFTKTLKAKDDKAFYETTTTEQETENIWSNFNLGSVYRKGRLINPVAPLAFGVKLAVGEIGLSNIVNYVLPAGKFSLSSAHSIEYHHPNRDIEDYAKDVVDDILSHNLEAIYNRFDEQKKLGYSPEFPEQKEYAKMWELGEKKVLGKNSILGVIDAKEPKETEDIAGLTDQEINNLF